MASKAKKPSGIVRRRLTALVEALPAYKVGEVVTLTVRKARALGLTNKNSERL